ncbi:MAG: acyl carrier protein [Nitrospiraceae bacterium]|nr:acyl carrier protein [Nitrospiraceae bacterium]MSR24801.1 acyl carrier protein [Nitrospiraceae bacterium]
MPAESDIAVRIRTAMGEYLKRDPASIEPRHALREDLGLDSMATIELLFKIEEVFDLQIPDQDLQKLARVSDVIAYVEGRVGKPAAPAPKPPAKRPASREKG